MNQKTTTNISKSPNTNISNLIGNANTSRKLITNRSESNLHIAFNQIERSNSHMRETTAENPTKSTSSVERRRVQLNLLRRLTRGRNNKGLRRRGNRIKSGWRLKHLLNRQSASGRRWRIKEAGDQRLTRGSIRERHGRWNLEQNKSKQNSNNGEENEATLEEEPRFFLAQKRIPETPNGSDFLWNGEMGFEMGSCFYSQRAAMTLPEVAWDTREKWTVIGDSKLWSGLYRTLSFFDGSNNQRLRLNLECELWV